MAALDADRRALIAQLVHEAKSPLVTLRGYLQLLRQRTTLDDRQATYVGHALDETYRQEHLLDAWFQAVECATPTVSLEIAPCDLLALVTSARETFQARHPERALDSSVHHACAIHCDADALGEVLANLLENAHRHGDAEAAITLDVASRAGEVVVRVTNQGPTIPHAELARLFEPHFRGQGARGEGAGLGLAVAERIVSAHGGRIWAESRPGRGVTVAFAIPVQRKV